MAITYRGERFAGYNKPKRTPKHPKKSHAVLAKDRTMQDTMHKILILANYLLGIGVTKQSGKDRLCQKVSTRTYTQSANV